MSRIVLADVIQTKDRTKDQATIDILDFELESFYRLCYANRDIGKVMHPYQGRIWQYIHEKRDSIKAMIESVMSDQPFTHYRSIFQAVIKEMLSFCEEVEMWTNIS